jgi:hypothetical protein
MTKVNTKPVVKNAVPSLYERHTFHMSKAAMYTYNYSSLDEYIIENYANMTIKTIANNLNEYLNRVKYRVEKLQDLGVLPVKYAYNTKEYRLKKEYLQQYDAAIKLYKELMAINPQALAG